MSETGEPAPPPPPSGPSSHRAESAPSQFGRLLAPLAAVLVVIVVIVLLIVINGHHSKSTPSAATTPPVSTPAAASSPSAPSTPTSSSTKPKPKPKHTRTARPKPKPKPKRTHHVAPPAPTAMAPVNVLNNSRRTGLAHEVAAEVQSRGWAIATVGNLQGLVAETTVYYAPGDEPAAQHLADEFSSIQRVEPDSQGGIHLSGLTLVLTRSWGE